MQVSAAMSLTGSKASRVNFFVVGAPKCGSTALYHFLAAHPEVDFGRRKEPHIFMGGLRLRGSTESIERYHLGYSFNDARRIYGDASIMHLYSEDSAGLIRDYNKDAKVLILLRPPREFIPSYFNEVVYNQIERDWPLRRGWELSGVSRDLRTVPAVCPDVRLLDYKSIANFDEQILRYQKHFEGSQIRIAFLDDIINRPRKFYLALQRYLDISDDGREVIPQRASTKAYSSDFYRMLVYSLKHPAVQSSWKKIRNQLGVSRRFGFVNRIQLTHTIKGVRADVDDLLLREIEAYYARSWERTEDLARQYALVS